MSMESRAPQCATDQTAPLRGKVAIITGASRGIGAAAARAFARAGAAVALAARDERALDAVVRDIRDAGGDALGVPTDVGGAAAVERLVRRTLDTYGHLDVAFNNAGANQAPAPLADLAVEEFDRIARVNLRGVFLALKYEIPAMRDGGAIVNMSSTAGLSGAPGIGAYVASKHGVVGLTRVAAVECAARGIRVNALAPGPTRNERIASLDDAGRERIAQHIPLLRIGAPEEIAAAAVWLCSDQAAFVTGTVLTVDGGKLAASA
jgi:NAD(P)-dependent dehydrogenase (short-subunit alcohol dehydrogenase family)